MLTWLGTAGITVPKTTHLLNPRHNLRVDKMKPQGCKALPQGDEQYCHECDRRWGMDEVAPGCSTHVNFLNSGTAEEAFSALGEVDFLYEPAHDEARLGEHSRVGDESAAVPSDMVFAPRWAFSPEAKVVQVYGTIVVTHPEHGGVTLREGEYVFTGWSA